jgi:hypothetical protein
LWKPKDCTLQNSETRKGVNQSQQNPQAAQIHADSAPLHWFKLTAGINGILPACGGPLPFIPLLALNQLRYALEEVTDFGV